MGKAMRLVVGVVLGALAVSCGGTNVTDAPTATLSPTTDAPTATLSPTAAPTFSEPYRATATCGSLGEIYAALAAMEASRTALASAELNITLSA